MRPNRIIVGEVRGAEAIDMLQALNTGHDGSLSTGHANSSRDMLLRLETMALMGYDSLLLHAPMLYFAMGKEWEGSILKINYNAWNCLDLGQFHILF
jgi:hypothetical protein